MLVAFAGPALAQPPAPAAVGRDRPLTSTWLCENERSVLLNLHPRRTSEEGWLTYAGARTSVQRVRDASHPTYASADARVTYVVRGDEATLSVEGVLQRPILCWRKEPAPR